MDKLNVEDGLDKGAIVAWQSLRRLAKIPGYQMLSLAVIQELKGVRKVSKFSVASALQQFTIDIEERQRETANLMVLPRPTSNILVPQHDLSPSRTTTSAWRAS